MWVVLFIFQKTRKKGKKMNWNKKKSFGRSAFKPKAEYLGRTKVVMKEKKSTYNGKQITEFTGVFSDGEGVTYILTAYEKPNGGFVHTDLKNGEKSDFPYVLVHVSKVMNKGGVR